MPLFPMFADLRGREVLVVGGGEVAARKIEALLRAGARVQVHARELDGTVAAWLREGRLHRREGAFDPAWLDETWLLVAATDDRAFNRLLAAEAGRRRRLVNVVDDVELSTFQVPSVVERGRVQVAISSGGAAPMLARRLRERLEALLAPSLGELAGLFARHREAIRARLPDLAQRRRWFDRVLDGEVPALLEAGHAAAAERAFAEALARAGEVPRAGAVWLLGVGHGDPDALTLRALRALNQADALLAEPDVAESVLRLARRDATRLPHPAGDDALAETLARHALSGQRVVHLRADDLRGERCRRLRAALAARGVACEAVG